MRRPIAAWLCAAAIPLGAAFPPPQEAEVAALEALALAAEREGRLGDAIVHRTDAIGRAAKLGRSRLVAALCIRAGRTLEADNRVQQAVVAYETGLRALQGEPGLDVERDLSRLRGQVKGVASGAAAAPSDLYGIELDPDLAAAERDPALVVTLLVAIGNAYARQPQNGPALNAYRLALARPEMADHADLRAQALANSGEILRRQGDASGADEALREALKLMEGQGDPLARRRVLALLAGIQRDRGEYDAAEATYREALELYAKARDDRGEGRAQAGLGRLYLLRGRFPEARAAYGRAVELGLLTRDEEILWYAYWGLGRASRELGDLEGAVRALRLALDGVHTWRGQLATDEGKLAFLEGARDVADQLIEVHLARARQAPAAYADALAVVEEARGRALSDLMARSSRPDLDRGAAPRAAACDRMSGPFIPDGSAEAAAGSPSAAVVFLPAAEGSRPGRAGAARKPPDSPVQMAPGIPSVAEPQQRQTASGIPSLSGAPDEAPDSPGAAAGPGASVATRSPPPLPRLVFHVLEGQTAVFAVSRDGQVRGHVSPIGRMALATRVAELRRALDVDRAPRGVALLSPDPVPAASDSRAEALLGDLYRDLVEPLAAALPAGAGPVAVEPHDVLWLVPFAALRLADGSRLADRWPMVHAPSGATLEEVRRAARPGAPKALSALIVGNPGSSGAVLSWRGRPIRFEPLRGAEAEARRVASLYGPKRRMLLVGPAASLETVVTEIHRFGVVHLATHGVASAEDPLSSFVLLGPSRCGEILTARAATALSLRADLVVLSACQTGLGRITGDGMVGLARSFLVAGARTVVVSQWSVDDAATSDLMAEFYRQYLAGGVNKPTALQRAMKALRSRPAFGSPRYWAPFVIVGAED